MTKVKHNCDNINCNHNDTKGLCCLFNPENCKYRQLQKENAKMKDKACCIIEDLKALYFSPVVTKDDLKRQDKILSEAEQFLKGE